MCSVDKACPLLSLWAPCPIYGVLDSSSKPFAVLVQMLIKGIRSFSPDNQNVVEFYKPLTLIVGQNGAGKTVRVELSPACP